MTKRVLFGGLEEIRTPDLCLRRALLYPTELQTHSGAGEGNRTLATSLEGWGSTTELHPHFKMLLYIIIIMLVCHKKNVGR